MLRSNRFISVFSFFATIFLFITTISLGLVFAYMDKRSPLVWLVGTMFIGMFIAFVNAINNMNTLLSKGFLLTSNNFYSDINNSVNLSSCPDYWTKNIVYDHQSKTSTTMCYNHFQHNGNDVFIGGELIKTTTAGTGGIPQDSYYFSADSVFPNMSLDEVRALAEYPENNFPVIENFGFIRSGEPGYQQNLHTHSSSTHIIDGNITPGASAGNIAYHNHVYQMGAITHSHTGLSQDALNSLAQQFPIHVAYTETYGNFDHWISPFRLSNGKYAIEINLTKLNQASNACELAKKFIWTEALNKCAR